MASDLAATAAAQEEAPEEVPGPELPELLEEAVPGTEADLLSSPAPPGEPALDEGFGDLGFAPPSEANPDGLVAEVRPPGVPVRELVELRDAHTSVWLLSDGSRQVRSSLEPQFFQFDGSDEWVPIDSTLVPDPDRAGWVRNAANSWTARFGPVGVPNAAAVELVAPDGQRLAFAPDVPPRAQPPGGGSEGSGRPQQGIAPVVGEDGESVVYVGVWPGVDLVYRVMPAGVKEQLVVHDPVAAGSDFGFVVFEGPELVRPSRAEAATAAADAGPTTEGVDAEPSGLVSASAGDELSMSLGGVDGTDRDGRPAGPQAGGELSYERAAGGGPARLRVRVSGAFLASVPASVLPLVIDPTVSFGAFAGYSFGQRADGSEQVACGSSPFAWCDGPGQFRVGNARWPGNDGNYYWRSAAGFNFSSALSGGGVVTGATLQMWSTYSGDDSRSTTLGAYRVTSGTISFGTVPGVYVTGAPAHGINSLVSLNVTSAAQTWVSQGYGSGYFGFVGEETPGEYTFRSYRDPILYVTVDQPPSAPTLSTPTDGATSMYLTPTLATSGASDPEPPWF